MNFNTGMFAKMREATSLLQSQGPMAATEAIQRALQGLTMPQAQAGQAGAQPAWTAPMSRANVMHDINPPPAGAAGQTPEKSSATGADLLARLRKGFGSQWAGTMPGMADVEDANLTAEQDDQTGRGRFIASSCSNQAGTRAYKLYIPSSYQGREGEPLPLIVMLHGCKQNPDDFARGTQMNQLAEENNCFVVYPGQAQNANVSNCWNWFKAEDQQRERGEPSIIADITREILRDYHIDDKRVYIAGLSAGGAMASVMAASYPDLYAAVGIHSGLPHGAAHDMPSAFAAMRNGMPSSGPHQGTHAAARQSIPVIVFHGDRDQTVHPRNGDQALAQCLGSATPKASRADCRGKPASAIHQGNVPNGHAYTKAVRYDDGGKVIAEHWTIHGAGHAWSGGSRKGSYTDPKGPNASVEMLRFFQNHVKSVRAI